MITAGRPLPDDHSNMINVGSLQPDTVLVSRTLKKIGILEVCCPTDESSSQLQAVIALKLRTYATLLTALKPYLDDGWQVQILPWVVGMRGLFITSSVTPVFKFLSIPSDSHTELLEETTLESVRARYLLHRTRGLALPPHNRMTYIQGCIDSDDPGRSCNRKWKRRSVEDYAVSLRLGKSGNRWKKPRADGADNHRRRSMPVSCYTRSFENNHLHQRE
jgi:hypothetical protein